MSAYARPTSLAEALVLLGEPGAVPMGGGTDLAGQVDRGVREIAVLVDLRLTGLDAIETTPEGGVRIGAAVTLSALAASPFVAPYGALTQAASVAASPLLRNMGTVAGNLCQHTRCWYYRGAEWRCWLGGGETCYAQLGDHRKHNLEPGDCISAHPSDLAPALAVCGATVEISSRDGVRELELLDLYRMPTADDRSLIVLRPGELVTAIMLPRPPEASTYLRTGERQAFSFPLVSVAAARHAAGVRVAAAGIANVPREIDVDDPLAGLPGNAQTGWKRHVLATLVGRALAEIA